MRVRNLLLALGTIGVGLGLHFHGAFLPYAARDVLGDALWAVMIVWWMGVVAPRAPLRTRGLAAFAICVGVEVSQRFHTPSLDALRQTVPGQFILGSGYDPRDFLAYAAGVVVALIVAHIFVE